MLHDIRSEYAQIMTCIHLPAAGPGPWSLDALLLRRHRARAAEGSSAASPAPPSGRTARASYAELAEEPESYGSMESGESESWSGARADSRWL